MIRFPSALTAETFLEKYWQKQPLFLPSAIDAPTPSLTRNELGWLATLDDVESRIVFTDRRGTRPRYCAEAGPFDEEYLKQLPKRDWTLLVHDVEKHLPEFRALFAHVPFIPDWRIDDLMVSFAAPGGSVGPHKDNYDVFLVQGTGARDWQVSTDDVASDPAASDELALLAEFSGQNLTCTEGDTLYLPPGVPHWGTAARACITYSIGMRAPQLSDLVATLPDHEASNPFYCDPDLSINEIAPGYISRQALERANRLAEHAMQPTALGKFVSLGKDWLQPERATPEECDAFVEHLGRGGTFDVHGMARIAWNDEHVFANGGHLAIRPDLCKFVARLCEQRFIEGPLNNPATEAPLVRWLLQQGTFDLPATS